MECIGGFGIWESQFGRAQLFSVGGSYTFLMGSSVPFFSSCSKPHSARLPFQRDLFLLV
jgi:hypothetical protein